jgi:hypothetical protein
MYWCLPVFRVIMPCFGRGTCVLEHRTIVVFSFCLYVLIVAHTYKVCGLKRGVFVKRVLKFCMCLKVSRF